MHLFLDAEGIVRRSGPAVQKLLPEVSLKDTRLFDLLDLRRPTGLNSVDSLLTQTGRKLHFATRNRSGTELKGVIVPAPDHTMPGVVGGCVLNLSLGISVVDAVREYALTAADFAATDLTVEMLYLVEAKALVMEELRQLNQRINGAREQAEYQASTDTLTGLGNRRHLDAEINRLGARQQRYTLMHLDLDHFKQVNDTFGHAAGDAVLKAVSDRLRAHTRAGDSVIRHGGDEFILVLPTLTDINTAEALGHRIIAAIEHPVQFGADSLNVSASIGASIAPEGGVKVLAEMMDEADAALYVVKENGRGGYRLYDPAMARTGDAPGSGP
jgi:diguanylate cyclase (GGDEF)-like protein